MPEVPTEALSTEAGFSLVELMIALTIAAIIAAFAIPSYQDHLRRSHLPEATSGLLLAALRLEQYYQDHRSYLNGAGCGVPLPPDHRFSFQCTASADGQSFLLTASGVEQGAMQGFTLTLDQTGNARTTALPEGWGVAPVDCWVSKRGGTC